jgi:hypothetical protein
MGKGHVIAAATLGLALAAEPVRAGAGQVPEEIDSGVRLELVQARRSCKSASTCREAVVMWCSGYDGADGDNDGIPCENVCPNKELVDRIREQIGC